MVDLPTTYIGGASAIFPTLLQIYLLEPVEQGLRQAAHKVVLWSVLVDEAWLMILVACRSECLFSQAVEVDGIV